MNILMINTINSMPNKGGMATYAHEIARGLSTLGDRVSVVTYPNPGAAEFDRAQPYETVRSPIYRYFPPDAYRHPVRFVVHYTSKILTIAFHLYRLVRRHRADAIFLVVWSPAAASACLVSRITGTPYFIGTHGLEVFPGRGGRMKGIMRHVFKGASSIFAVSRYTRDLLLTQCMPDDGVRVISNGIDSGRFRENIDGQVIRSRYGLEGRRILLTVSRLIARKGHDTVLRACPSILEKIPGLAYLIVGDGPERGRLEALSHDLGLDSVVVFAGEVDDADLILSNAACDCFVLPAREIVEDGTVKDAEGFGIAFLEAGACGKPVVGGRSGGIPDAIVDGTTGILVDPDDVDDVAAAVTKILSDPVLAARMGSEGRRRATELDWSRIVPKYREAIAGASQRGKER